MTVNVELARKELSELVDSGQLELGIARFQQSPQQVLNDNICLDLIDTAKRRLALIDKFTSEAKGVKRINCAKCKLPLTVYGSSSACISCYGCGQITDIATLSTTGWVKSIDLANGDFQIGMEGNLDKLKVQIIGCATYFAKIQEWDPEDECYADDTWTWREYSLLSRDGEVLYLCEDDEGYFITENFVPANPVIPQSIYDGFSFSESGNRSSKMKISEWGTAKITGCVGEFSWFPEQDSVIEYAESSSGKCLFGVEWRTGAGGDKLEVEFYKSHLVTYEYLLESFGLTIKLNAYRKNRAIICERICWATCFFVLAFIYIALYLTSLGSGRAVYSENINSVISLPEEGIELGPFNLSKQDTAHSIQLKAFIPDNSDLWIGAELLDENHDSINALDREFWRESGYDDGYWSESDIETGVVFNLTTPGFYYVRLFSEKDEVRPVDGKVEVTVREEAINDKLFLFCGISAGILALVLGVPLIFIKNKS